MNNIRVVTGKRPINEALVDLCRQLLADAESGHLTCLAGVAEFDDHQMDNLTAGEANWLAISACLHMLALDVAYDEDDED